MPVTGYSSYRFSTFVLIEARDEWQFLKEFDVSLAEDTVEVIVDRDATREGVRLQYEIETHHRRKDGTSLPVNTYFSAVSKCGPNHRTFLVTLDISARRAAEARKRGSIGAGQGRTTNNRGRDGRTPQSDDQCAVRSRRGRDSSYALVRSSDVRNTCLFQITYPVVSLRNKSRGENCRHTLEKGP